MTNTSLFRGPYEEMKTQSKPSNPIPRRCKKSLYRQTGSSSIVVCRTVVHRRQLLALAEENTKLPVGVESSKMILKDTQGNCTNTIIERSRRQDVDPHQHRI